MFQDFLIKKALKSQLGNLPKDQQEKILDAVSKNPELFIKIAKEVQAKVKEGQDQMTAMTEVMQEHQEELKKILSS